MAAIQQRQHGGLAGHPRAALDTDAVREAYRRWAGIYDSVFGGAYVWMGVGWRYAPLTLRVGLELQHFPNVSRTYSTGYENVTESGPWTNFHALLWTGFQADVMSATGSTTER